MTRTVNGRQRWRELCWEFHALTHSLVQFTFYIYIHHHKQKYLCVCIVWLGCFFSSVVWAHTIFMRTRRFSSHFKCIRTLARYSLMSSINTYFLYVFLRVFVFVCFRFSSSGCCFFFKIVAVNFFVYFNFYRSILCVCELDVDFRIECRSDVSNKLLQTVFIGNFIPEGKIDIGHFFSRAFSMFHFSIFQLLYAHIQTIHGGLLIVWSKSKWK